MNEGFVTWKSCPSISAKQFNRYMDQIKLKKDQ